MLFFYDPLHTGGRLLNKVLEEIFGESFLQVDCLGVGDLKKASREFSSRNKKKPLKVVAGFFATHQEASLGAGENVQRATVLRRPTVRLVAHYQHLCEKDDTVRKSAAVTPRFKKSESLEDFIEKMPSRPYLNNPYVRIFSGADPMAPECNEEMLQAAMDTLARNFQFVGTAERLDSSAILMQQIFGWSDLPAYPVDQVGLQAEQQWRELPPEVKLTAYTALQYDNKLYQWAADQLGGILREQQSRLFEVGKKLMESRMALSWRQDAEAVQPAPQEAESA